MIDILIPYEQLGDHGPYLHFAHANAYPPGSYRQLLIHLSREFKVLAIKFRPLWPESKPGDISSWDDIADDLISFLDQMDLTGIVGVGHSLGAVTTMIASIRRPDLFNSIILIEPVFLPPTVLAHLADQLLSDPYDMPLIKIAKKRRHHWVDRQEAYNHFRRKEVFARWPDMALWDYVNAGLRSDSHGEYELTFSPEWEAWIYAHPMLAVWDLIPQVTHPTLAIRGAESDTLVKEAWDQWLVQQPGATFNEIADSGHLLPMEKPEEIAMTIGAFLDTYSLRTAGSESATKTNS